MNFKECPCAELHLIHTKKLIIGATDNWETHEKLEKGQEGLKVRSLWDSERGRGESCEEALWFHLRPAAPPSWRTLILLPGQGRTLAIIPSFLQPSPWRCSQLYSAQPHQHKAAPVFINLSVSILLFLIMPWKNSRCSVCLLPTCWTVIMQGFLPP